MDWESVSAAEMTAMEANREKPLDVDVWLLWPFLLLAFLEHGRALRWRLSGTIKHFRG